MFCANTHQLTMENEDLKMAAANVRAFIFLAQKKTVQTLHKWNRFEPLCGNIWEILQQFHA